MDNKMNTPIITSLRVGDDSANADDPPTLPWEAPFLELLGLLQIIDKSQPAPNVDGQRLCFQPSHDLSEISRIFLSVTISSAQYDIDLKTIHILDSDAVPPAVNKLQEFANHVLQRTRLFKDRLRDRGVIKDSTCFLHVDLFTCPLCRHPLASCADCDSKVTCPRPMCLGSLVTECEICYEHQRTVCYACLTKNDTVPPLICCPICQGWYCREDTFWCAGLIVDPVVGTEELAELSREGEWDSETIVRSHPPKPGPCRFCINDRLLPPGWAVCRNSADDSQPDRCPSQTPFMLNTDLYAAYCPECIDQSPGCRCACGSVWLCDTCLVIGNKTIIYPFLLTCPRCGVDYCAGPASQCGDYLEICRGCNGVIICKDCQEEEALPRDVQGKNDRPKEVVFTVQCNYCQAWTCSECELSERTGDCSICNGWYCYNCVSDQECDVIQQCPFCNGSICCRCRLDHQGCPGAMMLKVVPTPQFVP